MPSTRTYQRTFIGGEISPQLWGRLDDPKYLNGCETMRNWLAMPQGTARRRPGTRFVREVRDSTRQTRLIPFTFGTSQSYAVELTGAVAPASGASEFGYIRLHLDGGTVLAPTANSALAPARKASVTVTFSTSSGNLQVNWTGHGFATADKVSFQFTTPPSSSYPIQPGRYYLVRAQTTNSFQIAVPGLVTSSIAYVAPPGGTITGHAYYGPGDFVTSSGTVYLCREAILFGQAPPSTQYWAPQSTLLEIPHTYLESQLRDVRYVQSNDVLTLTHESHPPRELRRLGAQSWSLVNLAFTSQVVQPPANVACPVTEANYGRVFRLDNLDSSVANPVPSANQVIYRTVDQNPGGTWADVPHGFNKNDLVRVIHAAPENYNAALHLAAGVYTVENNNTESGSGTAGSPSRFTILRLDGSRVDDPFTGSTVTTNEALYNSGPQHRIMFTDDAELPANMYVVTSVSGSGVESVASSSVTSSVQLENVGAYNQITWTPQYGGEVLASFGSRPTEPASYYRVYKERDGIYGYIGKAAQATAPSFRDDNISQDMGATPPIADASLSGTDYPRCVTYFEQRRVFASTPLKPQDVWMTRAATESDLTYHIPPLDTDRIYFRIAARTGGVIQHMVPMGHLVLLGSDTEWRVTPLNDDAVTPTSISVRPQSFVGASAATPQLLNNVCLYVAARGGHIRELGWKGDSSSYITGDVSLRAAHLFDSLNVVELALSKAPVPILWGVSSNGKLLGCTYIGEEQVAAWHQHDTDGQIESACVAIEGIEDALYVVAKRTIGGVAKRYVERLAPVEYGDADQAWFVDSGLQYYLAGTYTWAGTTLTVNTSTPHGLSAGNTRYLRFDGNASNQALFEVATTPSSTQFTVTLPSGSGTGTLEVLATTVSGLAHLAGKTVSILADGVVQPLAVVTNGAVSIPSPAVRITVGLPYTSDLKTLPLALQIDGMGQGRTKNVGKAWIKLVDSGPVKVGPDEGRLVACNAGATQTTSEVQVTTLPGWTQSGQVLMRVTDPTPATATGLTLEVAIGS